MPAHVPLSSFPLFIALTLSLSLSMPFLFSNTMGLCLTTLIVLSTQIGGEGSHLGLSEIKEHIESKLWVLNRCDDGSMVEFCRGRLSGSGHRLFLLSNDILAHFRWKSIQVVLVNAIIINNRLCLCSFSIVSLSITLLLLF